MDEFTVLLLSRYLDGDLGPSEARDLEERLRRNSQLKNDLAALEDLRASVAALAARDEPPAELDRLVEPLRQGVPAGPKIRPWLRWAGMAAAAVLAVTVVLEVDRRTPSPEAEQRSRAARRASSAEPTERFALAPLPTASTPEEQQPLGAADRLLASPIPEREVAVEEPALEVLGPLNDEEQKTLVASDAVQSGQEAMASAQASEETRFKSAQADTGRSDAPRPAPPETSSRTASPEAPLEAGKRHEAATIGEMAPSFFEGGETGRLFISVDGETIWRSFDPKRRCPPGRHIVRVEIIGGKVIRALPFGGVETLAPAETCAADLVSGLQIENAPDGEYRAEVVIEAVSTK